MVAANEHELNFINQRTEPNHEEERLSELVMQPIKFQSCWLNTHGMVDIGKTRK